MKYRKNKEHLLAGGFRLSSLGLVYKQGIFDGWYKDYDLVSKQDFTSGERKTVQYYNISCSFDIETSSFYHRGQKSGCMYLWGIGINGVVVYGRTWDDLQHAFSEIVQYFELSDTKRMIIYVHNLSYEFQWIYQRIKWSKVFAIDSRKVCYAVTQSGIEFRCSYILTGYSLEKVGEHLQKYPVKKLIGNLGYSQIRHDRTPLTEDEIQYLINDNLVVMSHIQECIEKEGNIAKIPLTKTGYVRRYCRNRCFYNPDIPRKKDFTRWRYKQMMDALILEPEEYKLLKWAFQGGFTHTNPFYSGKVMENVSSYDFTSSYPTIMVCEQFPMGKGEKLNPGTMSKEDFLKNLKYYCCLFVCTFTDICSSVWFETYISRSRCLNISGEVLNNGRVVYAKTLTIVVTEQDFLIISNMYKWTEMEIPVFYRYTKGLLPTNLVKSILKLYGDKTELKGVEGKEAEYLSSKEMINSVYGMMVTDIVRPEQIFNYDESKWDFIGSDGEYKYSKKPDLSDSIEHYNTSENRFLFYPWGVWVTAYARRNLFTGILEFKDDYIYSDTDSIKVINADKHKKYIEEYNEKITNQIEWAMSRHGIDAEMTRPCTIKGIKKPLGVWDFEGTYKRAKFLGAKRYLVEHQDGSYMLTVSGVQKKAGADYLMQKYADPMAGFTDELIFPAGSTGKLTHSYIDDQREGIIEDYLGNKGFFSEKSLVHLEPASYDLSISGEYVRYLEFIKEWSYEE